MMPFALQHWGGRTDYCWSDGRQYICCKCQRATSAYGWLVYSRPCTDKLAQQDINIILDTGTTTCQGWIKSLSLTLICQLQSTIRITPLIDEPIQSERLRKVGSPRETIRVGISYQFGKAVLDTLEWVCTSSSIPLSTVSENWYFWAAPNPSKFFRLSRKLPSIEGGCCVVREDHWKAHARERDTSLQTTFFQVPCAGLPRGWVSWLHNVSRRYTCVSSDKTH